jgi:hypothetical protein
VICRYTDKHGKDQYFLIRWDLDPAERLMAVCESLEHARILCDMTTTCRTAIGMGHPTRTPAGRSNRAAILWSPHTSLNNDRVTFWDQFWSTMWPRVK